MSVPSNTREAESASIRSSMTEEDLEEARQRLLDHMEVEHEDRGGGYRAEQEPVPHNGHLPQTTHLLPHHPHPAENIPAYGSVATMSLTSQLHRKPPRTKRYRLPLLILLAMDWGLVIFFSIIVSTDKDLANYFDLDIRTNYFDLVIIATFRFSCNFLFYLVLGWVTRLVMAMTTITSALYLPIKAYYVWNFVSSGDITIQNIALLLMLLVTFGMPWTTAFFFEFKYLPAELARLNIPSWLSLKAWVWPRAYLKRDRPDDTPSLQDVAERPPPPHGYRRTRVPLSASTVSLDFRTPVGSSRASPVPYERHADDDLPPIREDREYDSSMEQQSPECDRTMSAEDLRFKREALNAMDAFKGITSSLQGWTVEKEEGEVSVYSQFIDRKKVFKAEGVMPVSARTLFDVLYPGELTPQWNSQCAMSETIYRVDDGSDVVYTVANAIGPVSSRDFVSIRHAEVVGGRYYTASKAIVTAMKPEQSGKVRGENGPCGYVVIPISPTQCKLVWILNTNLKGWLPQSVIDQTLTTVLCSSFGKLKTYVTTRSQ